MSAPSQLASTYSRRELKPARGEGSMIGALFSSNLRLNLGTLVAMITAAATAEVQSLAKSGTLSAGQFQLLFDGQYTTLLNYNCSAADVQAALQALTNIGAGNVTCTGGTLDSTAVTITFAGDLVNLPQNLITVVNSTLTTGSAAVTRTTAGVPQNCFVQYDGSKVADPTVAPTMTSSGTSGSWLAASYKFAYTLVTAAGESLPSPIAILAATGSKKLHIAALTGLAASVTAVNLYMDGQFILQLSVSSNATTATDFDVSDVTTSSPVPPPRKSTAFVNSDGRQVCLGILRYDITTDEFGNVVYGQQATPQFGKKDLDAPVYVGGYFTYGDIPGGVSASAMADLNARFTKGSASFTTYAEILLPMAA